MSRLGWTGREAVHLSLGGIMTGKRIAVLSPVAWRTPPRNYGAWETVAFNIAKGMTALGWEVTLFATRDSQAPCSLRRRQSCQ